MAKVQKRRGIMLSRECFDELKRAGGREDIPFNRLGESFIRKALGLPFIWEGKVGYGRWTPGFITQSDRPSPPLPGAGMVMNPRLASQRYLGVLFTWGLRVLKVRNRRQG